MVQKLGVQLFEQSTLPNGLDQTDILENEGRTFLLKHPCQFWCCLPAPFMKFDEHHKYYQLKDISSTNNMTKLTTKRGQFQHDYNLVRISNSLLFQIQCQIIVYCQILVQHLSNLQCEAQSTTLFLLKVQQLYKR